MLLKFKKLLPYMQVVPILVSELDPSPAFGGSMDHRNFPSSSRMLMDQSHDRNHSTAEQSYDHMGTGIFKSVVFRILIQSLISFLSPGTYGEGNVACIRASWLRNFGQIWHTRQRKKKRKKKGSILTLSVIVEKP